MASRHFSRFAAAGAVALSGGLAALEAADVHAPQIPRENQHRKPVACKLIARETLSQPDSSWKMVRLRFATPDPDAPLGAAAPEAHVKVHRRDMWKDIARNYSICSPPEQKGSFDLCLKVWPGGVMSPYLAEQMPLGWSVDFDLSKARQFTAPFEGADAAGRNLLLVAFGIGIADLVYTARRAADAGQNVSLVYATRCAADAVLVPEMIELAHKYAPQVVSGASDGSPAEGSQAEQESSHGTLKLLSAPVSPAPAKRGSITTYILLSREDPSPVFLAGLPPGIIVKHARVDDESLAEVTNGWDRDMSTVHAVGGKVQKKSTMRSLEDLGFTHKLLPKINNVSRYF